MRRREFFTLLGGTAVAWPVASRAELAVVPVVGFLNSGSAQVSAHLVAAFRQDLNETGHVEGQNVLIEQRWANGQYDRLAELAADLVSRQVAVIAAGGPPAARAAKVATSTIPIVFTSGDDPVTAGLVPSLNRPGGNITGIYLFLNELSAKKLGLLRDLLPQIRVVVVLLNSTAKNADGQVNDLHAAANKLGLQIQIVNASTEREIDAAFTTISQQKAGSLIVAADPFFLSQREQIVALSARYAIPSVYELREFADIGGLMTYGTSLKDAYRQAGAYTGRILKGEKPANLPVMQSTKFELIINLKTAKTLGLTVPPSLLVAADELIE